MTRYEKCLEQAVKVKVHELKVNAEFWDALADGRKTFEVRRHDRDFQCGDTLHLRRWLRSMGIYSGSAGQLMFTITYILPGGQFGIEPGFSVLGISPLEVASAPTIAKNQNKSESKDSKEIVGGREGEK